MQGEGGVRELAHFAEIFVFAEIFGSEAARMATKWPAHSSCDAVVMLMDVATSLVLPQCYGCAVRAIDHVR